VSFLLFIVNVDIYVVFLWIFFFRSLVHLALPPKMMLYPLDSGGEFGLAMVGHVFSPVPEQVVCGPP
jgi:hypothetical protein